jgi:hypothetical protein
MRARIWEREAALLYLRHLQIRAMRAREKRKTWADEVRLELRSEDLDRGFGCLLLARKVRICQFIAPLS